jgi:hypothetical protein
LSPGIGDQLGENSKSLSQKKVVMGRSPKADEHMGNAQFHLASVKYKCE